MTDDDFAFLKSLPDYHEINEIYFFGDYFIQSGHHMVEISDTEKIVSLGDILGLTVSYRFVYIKNQSICVFIEVLGDVDGADFSIYFYSPELHEEMDFIKKILNYSIIRFGWDFNDNYDVSDDEVNFTFIESRNQYFDY